MSERARGEREGERKLALAGGLTMRKRNEAESCIAQNLRSLVPVYSHRRGASPSPSSPGMRVARAERRTTARI